jgi:hypothetical protein
MSDNFSALLGPARQPQPSCNPWQRRHQELLGKLVCIRLGTDSKGEPAYAVGWLMAFEDQGAAMLRDEAEVVTWCWPMLEVVEMCSGGCGCRLHTDDPARFECGCDGGCDESAGPQFAGNPKSPTAPAGWPHGYLPCGCPNDGYGRHAVYE